MSKEVVIKNWEMGKLTWIKEMPQTTYTNIAIMPDGTMRPWRGVKTTTNPPILKTDGQIIWLPKEDQAMSEEELNKEYK